MYGIRGLFRRAAPLESRGQDVGFIVLGRPFQGLQNRADDNQQHQNTEGTLITVPGGSRYTIIMELGTQDHKHRLSFGT